MLGAALPDDLASGAGPYGPCGVGDDEFCAALDRGTAGALQRVGRSGARRPAPPQWNEPFGAQTRTARAGERTAAAAAAGGGFRDEPQGGGLDGPATRARKARAAARMGSAQRDWLVDPIAASEEPE